MGDQTILCTNCKREIPRPMWNAAAPASCPSCGALLSALVFPALFRAFEPAEPTALVQEGTSACFFHPANRATLICDGCGRFLCELCEVTLGGRRLCPTCLEAGQQDGSLVDLVRSRILYDDVALSVAVIPLFMCYLSLLTAPVAIFLAARFWNAPTSLVPRTKARLIAAIAVALAEIIGWGSLIAFLIVRWKR